ncbi:MAG: prepilin-type N-terminal cleavage/methylation domain-containing protein [Acidobacteriota bacterium]|nr:prepilin-type N-terminal cleavage/methylation domain-containing protein [Acidobacteriota bacterium]
MLRRGQAGVTLIEMMIVVMIIAVIAGVSVPALTSGLSSVRLSSAAGSAASFLTAAMNRVERSELAAAIVISPKLNQLAVYTAASGDKADKTLRMPQGVSIEPQKPEGQEPESEEPRRFLLEPGGTFPRITLVLRNDKGARRSIKIDPATGVPDVQRATQDGKSGDGK